MTCNVTGTAISPNGQIKPGAKITFRRAQLDVVSQEGSFVIPDDYIIQTALDGTVDFDILPGVYDATTVAVGGRTVAFRVSVPDEPAADFADLLSASYVEIPPASVTQAQQARDAAIAARDVAVAARDEALLYDGPKVDTFAELASVTPAQLAVGEYIRVIATGAVYQRVSTGGDLDYSGTGGVRLTVIPIRGMVTPMMFGALPRFAGTTGRATSADCSVQMQAAINYVAAQNSTAGRDRCELIIDDYYAAMGITLPTGAVVRQVCPPYQGGIICPNNAPAGDIVALANAEVQYVTIKGLFINGNASSQTNTQRGFVMDLTGTSNTAMLRDFVVEDLCVHSVTGRGIHIGAYTRRSTFRGIRSYFAGEVGFYYAGSDCTLYDFDVAQSVGDGFVWRGSAGKISNGKVWGAGRYANGSVSKGYSWESGNVIISNCEAQENAGYGHSFFRSGSTLRGIVANGLTADADNVGATGLHGINIFNVQDSQIQAFAGKLNAALAGNPVSGVNIGGSSKGNIIDLTTSGLSSWPWIIASDSTENTFQHNGDKVISYSNIPVSVTPNSMTEVGFSGTLAADTTINNPSRKIRGFRLKFWIKQASSASYVITWGSDFIVNTALNRGYSTTTYFEFVSDGTNWIDVNTSNKLVQETSLSRTLTVADAGKVIDNNGATTRADFTLPSANDGAIGAVFEFLCTDGDGIRVIAPSGNTIRIGSTESSSFGSATTTQIGSTLRLIRGGSNKWVALSSMGTWTIL